MFIGRAVFSQIMTRIPQHQFYACVDRYHGNHRIRTFSCWDQFLCMAFAQLTYRDSLRDIESCLRLDRSPLYHMGIRGKVSRTTMAHANETRDWRIYADLAQSLIAIARRLYAQDDFGLALTQTAYAFDSTTIDLCLSLFPWAKFRTHKAAVKLHTLIDLRGNIPCFIHITDGKVHDVNALDHLILEPGAFYMFDRGYIDFARLFTFNRSLAFFVTRAKSNLKYRVIESRPVDKDSGMRSDQIILLTGLQSARDYLIPLRRVSYRDPLTHKRLVFLSNNFDVPGSNIPQLYKCRWQVELFFKWIKQNLRIKTFFGTSENAVKTQIWIAICVYVLVAILKKEMNIERSLSEILQILSVTPFEKVDVRQLLSEIQHQTSMGDTAKQLMLMYS